MNLSGQRRLSTIDLNKPIRFYSDEKKRPVASYPCFFCVWPQDDWKYKQWLECGLKADND